MTMTRSLRALCLAVMLALPWFCEVVRAQDDAYLRLLRDGVEEFGLGNWGEARLMFLRLARPDVFDEHDTAASDCEKELISDQKEAA